MISKFKNKKTCKKVVHDQKGGSSNPTKQKKPNVKKSLKTLKKMLQTAAKLQITSEYVTRKMQQKNYQNSQIPQQPKKSFSNLKKTEFQHVAHLVPNKNYWFTASAYFNGEKLNKQYQKYTKNHSELDSILTKYVKPNKQINTSEKISLYEKIYTSFGHKDLSEKNKTKTIEKIKKILHPSS